MVQVKVPDEVALAKRSFHTLSAQGEVFSLPSGHSNFLNEVDGENGLTPLHLASFHGHLSAVKLLLSSSDLNVEAVNNRGQSALFYAAFSGHSAIVKELLDHPCHKVEVDRVDTNGNTPLMFAAYNGKAVVVAELLKHFPDLSLTNNFAESVYSIAVKGNHKNIVTLLDSYLLSLFN